MFILLIVKDEHCKRQNFQNETTIAKARTVLWYKEYS